jgi:hypothetical protein
MSDTQHLYHRYARACFLTGVKPVTEGDFTGLIEFDSVQGAIRQLHPLRDSRRVALKFEVMP